MLTRYWQWTSAGADSGVPFGPLRYRQWTSATAGGAVTSLPFGPLRYRAWTIGQYVPPDPGGPFGVAPQRIKLPNYEGIRWDDEEVFAFIAALVVSGALH